MRLDWDPQLSMHSNIQYGIVWENLFSFFLSYPILSFVISNWTIPQRFWLHDSNRTMQVVQIRLVRTYYRHALMCVDLKLFWPGVCTIQLGTIEIMIYSESGWKILRRLASSSDAVGRSNGSVDQQSTKMSHSSFHSTRFRRPVRRGVFERSYALLSPP